VICGGMRRWLLLAVAFAAATALAGEPHMAAEGSVSYFCGGVGADERAAMGALEAQANLKLLFVTDRRGGYLADVVLAVEDGKGANVLHTVSDGPLCLLKLPADRYMIRASFGGITRSASVRVAAAATAHRITLAFPGEKWDGIWASDEEKKSARTPSRTGTPIDSPLEAP
jgi:hypothetical protein